MITMAIITILFIIYLLLKIVFDRNKLKRDQATLLSDRVNLELKRISLNRASTLTRYPPPPPRPNHLTKQEFLEKHKESLVIENGHYSHKIIFDGKEFISQGPCCSLAGSIPYFNFNPETLRDAAYEYYLKSIKREV